MIEEITIRRHWKKFYLKVLLLVLYYLSLALIVGRLYEEALSKAGEGFIILMSLSFIILALYTIVRYFKNVPNFYINTDAIVINRNTTFLWQDLERIELAGKRPFNYMFGYPREGIMFKFKGSNKIYLFDDMYANTAAIKRFIRYHIIKKTNDWIEPIIRPTISDIQHEQFVRYNGSQFLNYRGVILWIVLGLLCYGIIITNHVWLVAFLICLGIIFFWWLSSFMCFFGVSDKYFIVRNPNLFWVKKIYRLGDIKEVVFEQQDSNMPYSLRIISVDFESDLYMAGTLRNKKWRQLQENLEDKNINVRNECVF